MKKIKILLSFVLAMAVGLGAVSCKNKAEENPFTDEVLAKEGVTEYKILIPEEHDDVLQTAVEELQLFFRQSTGAELGVVIDENIQHDASAKYLSIGNTNAAASAGITVSHDVVGDDGYKIVTKDKSVYMVGGGSYGNLYAVYDFLKFNLGIKIYAFDEIKVPELDNVNVYDFDMQVRPTFDLRSMGTYDQNYNGENRRRLRMEYRSEGWIYVSHSHFYILPPSLYQTQHPDWYSKDGTQICMTNEEMRVEFTRNLIELIKNNPTAKYCMLGMQDRNTFCDCEKCSAEVALYNESGVQTRFTNKVAKDVQNWLDTYQPGREFTLFTYAYFKTTAAPVSDDNGVYTVLDPSVLPEKNVGVMIAPLAYSYTDSLDDPEDNAAINNIIQGWKQVFKEADNPNIYFYLYGKNFGQYLIPFGDYSSLKENYLMCQDAQSIGIFHLHAYNVDSSALYEMRSYVASSLMWDINQSPEELSKDFIKNYYKVAAPQIYEYYQMMRMHYAVLEEKYNLKAMPSLSNLELLDSKYWPKNYLEKVYDLMKEALAEVEKLKDSDPEQYKILYDRVLKESISVRYMLLGLYNSSMVTSELVAEIDSFEADCAYLGIMEVREHVDFGPILSEYIATWREEVENRV